MEMKQLFGQTFNRNKKYGEIFGKHECPFCQEKDLNQLIKVGEDNIKCMSCCNFYDCYFSKK